MKKKNTIPVIIFLIISLVAGLFLVRQSQETRRGAAFANTSLMVLPSEKIVKNVGEVLNARIFFETQSGAKVDGVQTVLCYGDELSLNDLTGVVANTGNGFDAEPIVVIKDAENGIKCATMVATSKKDASKLKTTGEVFSISFTAVKAGSGNLSLTQDKSMVTGDNPASPTDKIITVTSVANTTYEIVQTKACETNADCPTDFECYQPPAPTCPAGGNCLDVLPPKVCRAITTDPVLNYKVSFGSVKSTAKCAVNWPVQVIALSGGETKVYTNVLPRIANTSGDINTYKGSLVLTGFPHTNNIAVFFKGPKHLQMKYARQNQRTSYDKAGGELTLTTSAVTSPEYDFSAYPMLPGDIVGNSPDDAPNGVINGVDFSYLKNRPSHESVAEGGYLKGDLDGNCQINTNDVNILKLSLETKQGELY